jgi:hypothetical protein
MTFLKYVLGFEKLGKSAFLYVVQEWKSISHFKLRMWTLNTVKPKIFYQILFKSGKVENQQMQHRGSFIQCS